MEFLLYPASGLILAVVVFIVSQSHSRRFNFYMFWLLGTLSFVVSILTFLASTPDQRFNEPVSYYGVFGVLGFIAIVVSMFISQGREREALFSRLMEERQHRAASEITQLAASNSNLLELLNFSLDKIVSMLGLAGGAIHVFHRARESLVLGSYMGLSARLARRLEKIEFGDTAIGRTAKNKRLLIIRDLRLSQDYEFFGGKQDGFSYMALIPIVSDGENWGVITLFGKGIYQPGSLQVDLLEQFGEQLGAALVLGRRVRNMQASRDNLSSLIKALGEELCDTSSVVSGSVNSIKGTIWLITRLFGGDRYDLCRRTAEGWKITVSSEPGFDGKVLKPAAESKFALAASGVIGWEEPSPFEEFGSGRSFAYTSLFGGEEWFFLRLENKRKLAVDLELLTDAFRIGFGLYIRYTEISKLISKAQIRAKPQIALSTAGDMALTLSKVSNDLNKLISEYSGSNRQSDMKELLAWLETIRRSAENKSRGSDSAGNQLNSPKSPELRLVIQEAISQITRERANGQEIALDSENGIPIPDLPVDVVKGSILEFLGAALFRSKGKGKLHLRTGADNKAIWLELKGGELGQLPSNGEKPLWLSRINGHLEFARMEEQPGESYDYWRLAIPLKTGGSGQGEPLPNAIRVLAVDSQEVIRDLLTGMLTGLGYDAKVVATSEKALALFKFGIESGRPFTHVIADYGLDKISGLELAKELKERDPGLIFILISSWGLTPDSQVARSYGIDAMLKKPFRMEQLAEIIGAREGASR